MKAAVGRHTVLGPPASVGSSTGHIPRCAPQRSGRIRGLRIVRPAALRTCGLRPAGLESPRCRSRGSSPGRGTPSCLQRQGKMEGQREAQTRRVVNTPYSKQRRHGSAGMGRIGHLRGPAHPLPRSQQPPRQSQIPQQDARQARTHPPRP